MTDIIQILNSVSVNDIGTLFFFYLGEISLMLYIVLKLFDVKLSFKKFISLAFIMAFFVFFTRKLYIFYRIPLGTHSLILAVFFALLLVLFFRIPIIYAVSGSLLCFALIFLASPLTFKLMQGLNLSVKDITSNFLLSCLFGYIEDTYILLVVIILNVTKFKIPKSEYK